MPIALRPSTESDIDRVLDYFIGAAPEALRAMGVDPAKVPARDPWRAALLADEGRRDPERDRIFVTWLHEDEAIGHSSVHPIRFGVEACIHLHLWRSDLRKAGLGSALFQLSVDYFSTRLDLRRILCEPYAENPAPNRVLARSGFTLIGRHRTTPGAMNFEQDVNRWEKIL